MRVTFATARNVVIVLAIAAVIDIVPGGGTSADVVVQVISLVFLAALAWVLSLMYREHRGELYRFGDRRRAGLYASAVVLAVTFTATHRMWASALGSVAWLVLIAGALYAVAAILWSARRYP